MTESVFPGSGAIPESGASGSRFPSPFPAGLHTMPPQAGTTGQGTRGQGTPGQGTPQRAAGQEPQAGTVRRPVRRNWRNRAWARALRHARKRLAHALTAYVSPLGWTALVGAITFVLAFLFLGWHELLAMGVFLVSLVAVSTLMALGNTAFEAHLGLTSPRVQVGDDVTVKVSVRNPGSSPTASARAELPMGEHNERFPIPTLAPKQSKNTELTLKAAARGILDIGPLTVRKGDPFGLIRREKKLAEDLRLYIHPEVRVLPMLSAGVARDLEGLPSGDIVDDDLDFYGLREYVDGDDIRNVHWLSTARAGSMMIRQFEATRRTDTALLLGTDANDYRSFEEFELAVSAFASIGVQCLNEHRPLSMHAGDCNREPRNATMFLDLCSGIEARFQSDGNLAQRALTSNPNASFHYLVVGAGFSVDQIRHNVAALPGTARCVVVQVDCEAKRSVRMLDSFALVTISRLEDLPLTIGALR